MVTAIIGMEYTSNGYNSQHFGCCIGFCLCLCFGCMHRLTYTAGYNQLDQQFYMQLPRLEAAKPRPKFLLHPIILPKNYVKLLHHSHEFCIIAGLLKRPWCTLIYQGIVGNNDPMPHSCACHSWLVKMLQQVRFKRVPSTLISTILCIIPYFSFIS